MATATKDLPVDEMLEAHKAQFVAKLEELRPSYEAYQTLARVVANFDQIASGDLRERPRRTASAPTADRARRGQRPAEFLSLVQEAGPGGLSVSEAAERLQVANPNYLYRIAKDLIEAGEITKEGKRYFAV